MEFRVRRAVVPHLGGAELRLTHLPAAGSPPRTGSTHELEPCRLRDTTHEAYVRSIPEDVASNSGVYLLSTKVDAGGATDVELLSRGRPRPNAATLAAVRLIAHPSIPKGELFVSAHVAANLHLGAMEIRGDMGGHKCRSESSPPARSASASRVVMRRVGASRPRLARRAVLRLLLPFELQTEAVLRAFRASLLVFLGTVPRLASAGEVFTIPILAWPAGAEDLWRVERCRKVTEAYRAAGRVAKAVRQAEREAEGERSLRLVGGSATALSAGGSREPVQLPPVVPAAVVAPAGRPEKLLPGILSASAAEQSEVGASSTSASPKKRAPWLSTATARDPVKPWLVVQKPKPKAEVLPWEPGARRPFFAQRRLRELRWSIFDHLRDDVGDAGAHGGGYVVTK